jgi:integrase
MNDRKAVVDQFLQHTISPWTLPGGLHANDEDDQRRLSAFLKSHPVIEQAIAQRIASMPWHAATTPPSPPIAVPPQLQLVAQVPPIVVAGPIAPTPSEPPQCTVAPTERLTASGPLPKRPKRFKEACIQYADRYKLDLRTQGGRTSDDKDRLFDHLLGFLHAKHPELGEDPFVHEIDASHLSDFLAMQAKRTGRRVDANGEAEGAAPKTMLKKFSDLTHLFKYFRCILKATLEDPSSDMSEAAETWKERANAEDVHYEPFDDRQINAIFNPETLLACTRDPDHFWSPIIGLHLGLRLGEFVAAKVSDIGHIDEIDVWYLDITDEKAKNNNSVRRLPITEPLIRLGFLRYVDHVRSLGAEYLFPHRDWTCPTAERDRSKCQSGRFGSYLDALEIRERCYVFHSFRHTVVNAMQDAGVPLSHAMQIAGHQAQDHAVKTKRITEEQARSVHVTVYTRADLARMGQEYPILALKEALERSVKPQLDYDRLAKAAEIVRDHVKKVGGKFRTGWPAQRAKQTAALVARLNGA